MASDIAVDSTGKSTWIFQAVPDRFDLMKALQHLRVFRWNVNQNKARIRAGDDVYLWLAGSKAGIVARGKLLTDPTMMADAPEEAPFEKETEAETPKLRVAIEVRTVFPKPIFKDKLKDIPALSSMLILTNPRGTNFPLTEQEAIELDALGPSAEGCLVSVEEAFANFRRDPVEMLRVRIRQKRAEQLRVQFAEPTSFDLETFNQNVWKLESSTVLNGREIKGRLYAESFTNEDLREEIRLSLEEDSLELHGNYIWNPGSSVFGSKLGHVTDEGKTTHIQKALRQLTDSKLTAEEKAAKVSEVPGFGPNSGTGLAMVCHPEDFAIWNKQSRGAFAKLGLNATKLESFEESARQLKEQVGATDFLELDWFLYLVNQGQYQITDTEVYQDLLQAIDDELERQIRNSPSVNPTEIQQLIKARRGQGVFRRNVAKKEPCCRLTGIVDERHLIASHIKPWKSCTNTERLDGDNGLLLSPNVDHLFDKGHISFADTGDLLISQTVGHQLYELLGIPAEGTNCGSFSPKQREYLSYHRTHLFRD